MRQPSSEGPRPLHLFAALASSALLVSILPTPSKAVAIDLTGYRADCGVRVGMAGVGGAERLNVAWPISDEENGTLVLETRPGLPLIASLGIEVNPPDPSKRKFVALLQGVDPFTTLTVGTRSSPPGRPPGMSVFNVFFDSPAQRPHQAYRAVLNLERIRVVSQGRRASIILGAVAAGPFSGTLHLTVYPGARLVQVETVVHTEEEPRAFLYDTGLVADSPNWRRLAWVDTEGNLRRQDVDVKATDQSLAVRHRTLLVEADEGTVAVFPPPHQYFFARDRTDNLKYVWAGRDHRDLERRYGFGIRQTETGGGNYSPWFNAPPGTEQRLGVFYLLSRGNAGEALKETLRYTHGDRFPPLPGHLTFTSHWHMAIAVAAMAEIARGQGRTVPDFATMFKAMGVNIVHLAEFHGDGHQKDPGPLRLPEVDAMFAECRRLSDHELLVLPGEEVDTFLAQPGHPPGHWMCLFPKPVLWTMKRSPTEPLMEDLPQQGRVYRVGSRDDMVQLLEREHGLAWSSHPRIKASNWTPDAFREQDFYKADAWLGAAWKALPSDLSQPQLGRRALDLLDDMANWGQRKYLPGEVDVFKIDHTHELYGHMNVNYLRLDRLPKFDESWQPVLDALRRGRFFVTTGEVLLREFSVGGKSSGETLALASAARPEVRIALEWTFPLRFAELVSGDGTKVYRDRIDLADTGPFGQRTILLAPDLSGRKWIRAEAWDVAGNGTFSQTVWIGSNP